MTPRETKTGKTMRVLASECSACRAWHACPPKVRRLNGPETRVGPETWSGDQEVRRPPTKAQSVCDLYLQTYTCRALYKAVQGGWVGFK